jgi:hypothetical protein
MGDICLKIPEQIVNVIRFPPGDIESELKKELSLALYQRGVLTSGNACILAGLNRWQFNAAKDAEDTPALHGTGSHGRYRICP